MFKTIKWCRELIIYFLLIGKIFGYVFTEHIIFKHFIIQISNMKSCNKLRVWQLTLLIILALFSCKKEDFGNTISDTSKKPTLPYPELIDYQTEKYLPNTDYLDNQQLVLDIEEAIREITFNSIFQTAIFPQVYGLDGESVTTRSCPNSSLSTASGAGGNVHTITLDYGTGCSTDGNAEYEGIVTVVLNGDLNTSGTTVNILLDDDFKINSDNDMDGLIKLTYIKNSGLDSYVIDTIGLTNTNLSNSNVTGVTSISAMLNGGFQLAPNPTGDLGNALDIVNDTIQYNGCFLVHCPNAQTLRSCTLTAVNYSIPCGTPFEGEMILDTMVTGGGFGFTNPVVGNFGNMDFSFPNITGQGVCDSLVKFTDNISGQVDTLRL